MRAQWPAPLPVALAESAPWPSRGAAQPTGARPPATSRRSGEARATSANASGSAAALRLCLAAGTVGVEAALGRRRFPLPTAPAHAAPTHGPRHRQPWRSSQRFYCCGHLRALVIYLQFYSRTRFSFEVCFMQHLQFAHGERGGGVPRLVATSQLATSSTAVVPRSFWVLGGSCPHFTPKIAHAAPSIFHMPFAYDTARAPCSAAEIVSVSYGFVL